MTPTRVATILTLITAFLLLGDYGQSLKRRQRFDLSRSRTVVKVNGVPVEQLPGQFTNAQGMFRQRLAPFDGGLPASALLYPSGRPTAAAEPPPAAIAAQPAPSSIATR